MVSIFKLLGNLVIIHELNKLWGGGGYKDLYSTRGRCKSQKKEYEIPMRQFQSSRARKTTK